MYLDLAALILELLEWNNGFGLEPDIDDDHIGTDIHHQPGQNHPRANTLIRQALLEQFAEALAHTLSCTSPCLLSPCLRHRGSKNKALHPAAPTYNCLTTKHGRVPTLRWRLSPRRH